MTLGENIKTRRENMRITQTELGEQIGVRQQTVYDYERNFKKPSIDVLQRIAEYFDCSLDELVKPKK